EGAGLPGIRGRCIGCGVPDDEPTPLGPDIDRILNGLLSEHVARERARLLQDHGDAVRDIQERARNAWEEMLGQEMTMLLLWGLEERGAELAAKNNLAMRKAGLDDELLTELARLQTELTRKVKRLVEDPEDEREG